jgi:TctA family transporter
MLGNEVAVLAEEYKLPGQYRVTFDATGIPSGIYLCKLNVGDFVLTRKLILMEE